MCPVDHTGIDLIARRPNSPEVLGISVKSRAAKLALKAHTRTAHDGFAKLRLRAMRLAALPILRSLLMLAKKFECSAFTPHLQKLFPGGRKVSAWQMSEAFLRKYYADIKSKSLNSQPTIKSGFEVSSPQQGVTIYQGGPFCCWTVKPKDGFP